MGIFTGVEADRGDQSIGQALAAIMRRARERSLLYGRAWSLLELGPDNDDYEWIQQWVWHLDPSTATRWLEGRMKCQVDGHEFRGDASIGLLLLLLITEIGRREASETSLWSTVAEGAWRTSEIDGKKTMTRDEPHFQPRIQRLLWYEGYPRPWVRDALERAARRFNLRHVFGKEGVQAWFSTVFLQFGFSHHGAMHSLPNWLAGFRTQAIERLTTGPMRSESFVELWEALENLRRKNIEFPQLQRRLAQSPWVLPEWIPDLARAARKRPELQVVSIREGAAETPPFLDEVTLHWTPPARPDFRCRIANLARLDLSEPTYRLWVADRLRAVLIRQGEEGYAITPCDEAVTASGEILLPVTAPSLAAHLEGEKGSIAHSMVLEIWDPSADLTVFRMTSGVGRSLPDPDSTAMVPECSYGLLLPPDLELRPAPDHWHLLERETARLCLLEAPWDSSVSVQWEGQPIWRPVIRTAEPRQDPVWAASVSLAAISPTGLGSGRSFRIRISHPPDVTITFVRFASHPVDWEEQGAGVTLTAPVSLATGLGGLPLQITLGLRRGEECVRVRRPLWNVDTSGAWLLAESGWTALDSDSRLRADDAARGLFQIIPPGPSATVEDGWVLMEGDLMLCRLRSRARPIGRTTGLGAPLTARRGPYNSRDPEFPIAHEVHNTGLLLGASWSEPENETEDGTEEETAAPCRTLRLFLSRFVEPGPKHLAVWWDADGTLHTLLPSLQAAEPGDEVTEPRRVAAATWTVPLPAALTRPIAVAVTYEGAWLGAWWKKRWYRFVPDAGVRDPVLTATRLRWFRLPLLSPDALSDVRRFAIRHPWNVLRAWLFDPDLPLGLCLGDVTDGWLNAVRKVFEDWCPDAPTARRVLRALAQADGQEPNESFLFVASRLARVDPLLMGRILKPVCCGTEGPHLAPAAARKQLRDLRALFAEVEGEAKIRAAKTQLIAEAAETMGGKDPLDPLFLERGLLDRALACFKNETVHPSDLVNLGLASEVEPFRRVLALRVLEELHAAIR